MLPFPGTVFKSYCQRQRPSSKTSTSIHVQPERPQGLPTVLLQNDEPADRPGRRRGRHLRGRLVEGAWSEGSLLRHRQAALRTQGPPRQPHNLDRVSL